MNLFFTNMWEGSTVYWAGDCKKSSPGKVTPRIFFIDGYQWHQLTCEGEYTIKNLIHTQTHTHTHTHIYVYIHREIFQSDWWSQASRSRNIICDHICVTESRWVITHSLTHSLQTRDTKKFKCSTHFFHCPSGRNIDITSSTNHWM